MIETKKFNLRTILTVITGRLLTKSKGVHDNGISDLYKILGWMTNDEPYTHQLGRFMDECKPWLLRWFPLLAKADLSLLDTMIEKDGVKGCEAWIESCYSLIGCDEFDVPRIPADDHERKDPIDELISMRGTDKGVVVVKPS